MNITYERETGHCEKSPYIKEVTIKTVEPAENSDNLDKVTFLEIGWDAITRRGDYNSGNKVMFIPPESVLPLELGEKLGITNYLSKGRVRVTKLRGNRSEGLIVDRDIIEPYIPFILKWEDLPSVHMKGELLSLSKISIDFLKFYKMPNILNEPDTFEIGERLSCTEKLHGTHLKCGRLLHPVSNEFVDYVGSHNTVLKEPEEAGKNIYWDVFRKSLQGRIPEGIVLFGEIFGLGIQHISYDRKKPDVLLFAAMHRGIYLSKDILIQICTECCLPYIPTTYITFESIEQMRELAESPSDLTKSHGREGIVLTSLERPDRMAKCISFKYLTGKNRKERH